MDTMWWYLFRQINQHKSINTRVAKAVEQL